MWVNVWGWNPNLPDNDFIQKQTGYFGWEVMIYGLTRDQADAIIEYARDSWIDVDIAENPLLECTKIRLDTWWSTIPRDSVEISLGHTIDCETPLFEALGIL